MVIGNSVTSIGNYAFSGCPYITTVVSNATTPPAVNNSLFDDECYANATLIVPDGSVDLYKEADVWKKFYKIVSEKEATAVSSVSVEDSNKPAAIYDLQGRRLKAPQKGLNIINGRKVLVK